MNLTTKAGGKYKMKRRETVMSVIVFFSLFLAIRSLSFIVISFF